MSPPLDAYLTVPSTLSSPEWTRKRSTPAAPQSVSPSKSSAVTSNASVPTRNRPVQISLEGLDPEQRNAALKRSTDEFNAWLRARKADKDTVRRLTMPKVVSLWHSLRARDVSADSSNELMRQLRGRMLSSSTYWRVVYEEASNER